MFQINSEESEWELIEHWASRSTKLFLKKLSRNDTSWADDKGKHQAGIYIPRLIRESDYFPPLIAREDKPHIFQASCITFWPQTGERRISGMRHYSNKGPETHLTVVPHDLFRDLSPASWLIGGKLLEPVSDALYWFIVIDSTSQDAELLETSLDIKADFHHELIEPSALLAAGAFEKDVSAELIEQIDAAARQGTLSKLLASVATLPSPSRLAEEAQSLYLAAERMRSLNPYDMEAPGDAVMRISRDHEYRIFKRHELRRRAVEVYSALTKHPDLTTSVVRGFPDLDRIFLSASQQRKTRAGRSFEYHLATLLKAGNVRFEEQAILGGRRPDFVLPDKHSVQLKSERSYNEAAILSAKTTLRERWKQVTHERFNCAIFLATVDDRVSSQALDEMQTADIALVVPESLKTSKEAAYAGHPNVISFKDFFEHEIRRKRPTLLALHPPALL
ncbi:type II restriction endonuclease [Stenotrophomonas sp. MH1]|uniref:Type II restriction endonuclease n=1 Tax=Stenotrophomonas capsici TaxID=3110230 RepID=A0ABU5VCB4_9GAMM|nr:type II restriction endonuclease [Stenotrophomonas sp. MH1]MEA5669660.1 type II restriction endonuclease [Stenotrophomonas sp. MH1]